MTKAITHTTDHERLYANHRDRYRLNEHEASYAITLRFTAGDGTPSPNPEDIADAIEKQLHTRGYPNASARVDQL